MWSKYSIGIFTLAISGLIHAQKIAEANPKHIEIFDTRNFCVLCTFNDALLSPDTLYGPAHSNANISGSYVYRTVMDQLDLTFAFMYAVKGERFTITNSKVKMINLTYSDLPYIQFMGNDGELVNFTGSGLDYGGFRYSQLDHPIFTGTSLEETDFTGVNFKNAYFINTQIAYTNFTDANLEGADFTKARISQANFSRANLLNAKITLEQLATSNICDALLPDGSRGDCSDKET
jgi:uncharacterized protein YjbI with pentapeptide repeats